MVGLDERGHVVLKQRLTREALLPCIAQLPPLVIGMEAGGGAHDWARRFREHGHPPQLIAPQFVKPYIQSNTKDPGDAAASCEAVPRPTRRFVPIQEVAHHDRQGAASGARAGGQSPYGPHERHTGVRHGLGDRAAARGHQIPVALAGHC